MDFDTLLTAWKIAAVKGEEFNRVYEVSTERAYMQYCTLLDQARISGIEKGYMVKASGAANSGGKTFRISLRNAQISVWLPSPTTRAQAVTDTSRVAYAAFPKETDVQRYIRAGIAAGPGFSDADVATVTGWPKSTVSGRRNDAMKADAVNVDGVEYRVRLYGNKRDPGTKMTVRTYEIVRADAAMVAHQLEMF